jgi:hypothetical protein
VVGVVAFRVMMGDAVCVAVCWGAAAAAAEAGATCDGLAIGTAQPNCDASHAARLMQSPMIAENMRVRAL